MLSRVLGALTQALNRTCVCGRTMKRCLANTCKPTSTQTRTNSFPPSHVLVQWRRTLATNNDGWREWSLIGWLMGKTNQDKFDKLSEEIKANQDKFDKLSEEIKAVGERIKETEDKRINLKSEKKLLFLDKTLDSLREKESKLLELRSGGKQSDGGKGLFYHQ